MQSDRTPSAAGEATRSSLAKIRHDLRTPINHIIGYSEILLEETRDLAPAEFAIDLERIRSGGHQLLALINQHLGDSPPPAGVGDPAAVRHDLRTPVNQIIGYSELLSEQCDELGLTGCVADLAKIGKAASNWLALMEKRLLLWPVPPRAGAAAAAEPAPPAEPAPESPPSTPRFAEQGRVLVVDDDEANRDILRRRLEKQGHQVETCTDGRDALALLQAKPCDLVLMDVVMPGLEGPGVLARMKTDERLRHIPVIMISALDRFESAVQCIELGAEDYLAKPVNPILLQARVGAALEKKRLRDLEQVYLRRIETERAKSDRLLLNVLPRPIAERLKQGEGVIADSFADVTVLFADLVGFTALSLQTPPSAIVRLLDAVFSEFDDLAAHYGLEKIKTIGDAYMAAAGLPLPRADHAEAAVRMALEMMERIGQISDRHGASLSMRIGVSSGPVTAGVIGRSRFIYDLWGDTVNTASRMESQGEPGMIQLSEDTARRLPPSLAIEKRGLIEVKGKGGMTTFIARRQ